VLFSPPSRPFAESVSVRSDMDVGIATVVAAVVGGVLLLLSQLIGFRRENREDHAVVAGRLDTLNESVKRVEGKVDDHIVDHAKGLV
jgi:hypothetical protein